MEKSQLHRREEEQKDTWSHGRKAEGWGHPVGGWGKEQLCRQRGYADILGWRAASLKTARESRNLSSQIHPTDVPPHIPAS